ncbi:DUF2889 domain-containing protein [Rhodococcus aetherivorans]
MPEYLVKATADPVTGELLSLSAYPRVLPYDECPLASLSVDRIFGTPLRDLRVAVLEIFPGTGGTHLNDAMRAMAEVPVLVDAFLGQCRSPAQLSNISSTTLLRMMLA